MPNQTAELHEYDVAITMVRKLDVYPYTQERTFRLRIPAVSAEKAEVAAGWGGIAWGINEASDHQWKTREGSVRATLVTAVAP